ncbi:class I SAM-dependent methyltransferase [Leptospira sp. GIMC2001]|uniref:class I SAM-dependent methyltransferase n=1 Tax=Leptospira sp. GIMC2001 TaxID=1513297 RepID=UPI00234B6649|nr:class I SAM-dependent methyltransferase [Leptospira sp. GIMC2001]WCL49327.1 class I SAM-dependent methyltransferase [Leptospira sp. GIMC2001]
MLNSSLLGDVYPFLWENLGYWNSQVNVSYHNSCEEMVRQHFSLLKKKDKIRILDLACGKGGSIITLTSELRIARLDAMDIQEAFLKIPKQEFEIRKLGDLNFEFEKTISGNSSFPIHFYDSIVCIDSAYHFKNIPDFIKSCKLWLNSTGELVFTTVSKNSDERIGYLDRFLFYFAGISTCSVLENREINQILTTNGFSNIKIQTINEQVLRGFANWVDTIRETQSIYNLFSFDWIKIKATALFCKRLLRQKKFSYVLLYGQRGY